MKTIYLGLDYDGFADIFSDETENRIIEDALENYHLPKIHASIFRSLAKEYQTHRDTSSPISDFKKTVENFINIKHKELSQNKPLKKGLLTFCRFLETRRLLLEKLKSFAKGGERVVILTTSLRQSDEADQFGASQNLNGSCEDTLAKLANEQKWEFNPIRFYETGTDRSKITILLAHFKSIKREESPGDTSEFYLLDDLDLKELRLFFKKNPEEILDNMTFFVCQFNWIEYMKYVQFMQCVILPQLIPNSLQKDSHIASTHAQIRSAFTRFTESMDHKKEAEVSPAVMQKKEVASKETSWFSGITHAASSLVKTIFTEEQVENQDNEDPLENQFPPKLGFKF